MSPSTAHHSSLLPFPVPLTAPALSFPPFKVVACDFLLAIYPCSAVQDEECMFFLLLSVGFISKIWLVLDVQRGEEVMGGGIAQAT